MRGRLSNAVSACVAECHHMCVRVHLCVRASVCERPSVCRKKVGRRGHKFRTECTQQEAPDIKLVRDAYVINISRLSQAMKLCSTQPPFFVGSGVHVHVRVGVVLVQVSWWIKCTCVR